MFFEKYPSYSSGSFFDKNHIQKGRISADGKTVISSDSAQIIGYIRNNKLYDSFQNHAGYFKDDCLYDLGGGIRGYNFRHNGSTAEIIAMYSCIVLLLIKVIIEIKSVFFI